MSGHDHETRDIRPRDLAVFTVCFLVFVAASVVFVTVFQAWARGLEPRGERRSALWAEDHLPPEPRLETSPPANLNELRRQEEAALSAYGWTDRGAGLARVPIERAMELYAAQGESVGKPTEQTNRAS